MTIELLIISVLRTLVEVALLSLLGQGAVGLIAGGARQRNPIYHIFCIITRPPIRMVRLVIPRIVIDRHIPYITFFVLFWLWILLAYAKRLNAG